MSRMLMQVVGVRVAILAVTLGAWCRSTSAAEREGLRINSDFEGGSVEVLEVDAEGGRVRVCPALREERGWPCWWYFRVEGVTKGQAIVVTVSGQSKSFQGTTKLAANWAQPDQAAISTDDVTWTQTPKGTRLNNEITYRFEAPASRFYLAWGPPFLPRHASDLVARLARSTPRAETFELAKTRGDRPVVGLRVVGGTEASPARYGVWVNARQHAWEAGGSWVGVGFIEWVCGDDPAAVALRKTTTIHYVPIMDVDNVALGAGGKEAVPRDHNRDWSDTPHYPEVAAAQRALAKLNAAGQLHMYLDLHNPGANEYQPYFFGPFGYDELDPLPKRNYAHFHALATELMREPLKLLPQYKFATYVKTAEERSRMSSMWVREHSAPYVVSTTLETAWNTPQGTTTGYRAIGRHLGETVARYFEQSPTRP